MSWRLGSRVAGPRLCSSYPRSVGLGRGFTPQRPVVEGDEIKTNCSSLLDSKASHT